MARDRLREAIDAATAMLGEPGCSLEPLDGDEVRALLRSGTVALLVDRVREYEWHEPAPELFNFWKDEVAPHVADPEEQAALSDWPGEYCYFAYLWQEPPAGLPSVDAVVVLRQFH